MPTIFDRPIRGNITLPRQNWGSRPKEYTTLPIIRGRSFYAKITQPVPTYDKKDKEWTFDLLVDAATKKQLAALGLGAAVKVNKNGDDFIKFSRRVTKSDGTPSKPLRVVDNKGQPWDHSKRIGNDSVLNVQFEANDKAMGGKKAGLIAVQVWEHVPFEGNSEFEEFPVDNSGAESWEE